MYVGSAEDEKHDQVLDCVMVGPVVQGKFKFVFQVRAAVCLHLEPTTMPSIQDSTFVSVLACSGCRSACLSRRRFRTSSLAALQGQGRPCLS